MVSFLATACWDVSQGLIISLIFALATIVIRIQYPKTSMLEQISQTEIYRNPERYGIAFESSNSIVFHFEASLLFVNCDFFKEKVFKAVESTENAELKQYFILDSTSINSIDQMGIQTLIEVSEELKQREITFMIAGSNESLIQMFNRCKIYLKIERKYFFISISDAIVFANIESNPTVSVL
uniref:STAS domain-containing protein n=1 Tax=Panagrolaimus davidi TaxID=227884 RepID=A0A914P434_9BILA